MNGLQNKNVLFYGIMSSLFGVYALITDMITITNPTKVKPWLYIVSIQLSRLFRGEKFRDERAKELLNPKRIRSQGYMRVIVGSLLIAGGVFEFLEVIFAGR